MIDLLNISDKISIVRKHTAIAVLLILMLQQLTELTERLVALLAAVGHVGHRTRSTATVSQKGTLRHVLPHRPLRCGEVINLLPRIVLAKAALAETRLHVLHRIRPGAEALLSAHRARHVARSVDLHVHVQLVLRVEVAIALAALIGHATTAISSLVVRVAGSPVSTVPSTGASVPTTSSVIPPAATISVHTTLATGQAGAFPPLVRAEVGVGEIVTAIAAFAAHDDGEIVLGLGAGARRQRTRAAVKLFGAANT